MKLDMSFNFAFNCIYGILSLNNSWLRDFSNALFLLEFEDTNHAAIYVSHLELCPEKLTERVV